MGSSVEQITDYAGLLLAIFALIAGLFQASVYLAGWYSTWLRRRRIKGLLLKPTIEELAKYSKGMPANLSHEEREYQRNYTKAFSLRAALQRIQMERRQITLAFFMIFCFSGLALRFYWVAFR